MRFEIRDAEVNAVKFFPGGEAVAAAGNDGIVSERKEVVEGEEEESGRRIKEVV